MTEVNPVHREKAFKIILILIQSFDNYLRLSQEIRSISINEYRTFYLDFHGFYDEILCKEPSYSARIIKAYLESIQLIMSRVKPFSIGYAMSVYVKLHEIEMLLKVWLDDLIIPEPVS